MQGRLTLRERMVVLVAAALVPVAALLFWVALREGQAAAELGRGQLRLSASLLAAREDRRMAGAEQLLRAIAAVPGLGEGGARCQDFFRRMRGPDGAYTNIGLAAPDGRVLCHALGDPGAASAAGRDYFSRALATGRFVMGEPITGRVSGRRGLPFAMPLLEQGRVTGVLFALADLGRVEEEMAAISLPEGAHVAVSTRQGRLVMAWPPGQGQGPGQEPEPTAPAPSLPASAREVELQDADGVRRFYAFGQTRQVEGDGLVVRVGLPPPALLAGAGGWLGELAAAAALTLGAILLLAWWLGGRFIIRPADEVLRAVRAFEAGDLGARVALGGMARTELARIGAAFNRLADALQARQLALEDGLERSRSALALLDQVVHGMQEALLAVGPRGELLLSNPAAQRLFPLDARAPGMGWFGQLGFHGPDGETPWPAQGLPLALAAAGGTGQALAFIRNERVPEGRLVQCSWQALQGGRIPGAGGLVVFTDLTELRRMQVDQIARLRELEEARRKLEEAQRIGRMGHWEQDLATGRLGWSDEVFVLLGVEPGAFDFTFESFLALVHPEDRPRVRALRGGQAHRGRMAELEYRVLRPQGGVAWMHEIAKTRLGAAGEPVWLAGVVQDVTRRKLQEQALREGEQAMQRFSRMLQRAAEAAPVVASRGTAEGVAAALREQALRVLGVRDAEVRLGPAPREPHVEGQSLRIPLCDAGGEVIGSLHVAGKAEGLFDERDGAVAMELVQVAAVALRNAQLLAQVRELNAGLEERIASRTAELARQERLFRALAEQAPEVVWNTDGAGHVTFLNRAWYELVGGGEPGSLGRGWISRLHPQDREPVLANWERSRATRAPFSGTRRFLGRDGRYHTMSYRAAPILDEAGEVTSWVGIDADVSALKAVEDALRASNEELEAFSYSVSHDLRAPLAAIAGFSEALQARLGGQADERSSHYLSRVLAGVRKMERQIDAMLSLARVARAPLEWAQADLSAIALETLEGLRMAHPGREVAAFVEPGMSARGDPRLLRVLLENLLGNAWKFTSHTPQPRIEFGHDAAREAWFVRDNGAGFDMHYAGKLFNAFRRLHTEQEFPGTGVGLATVRRIVARHGGRIWADAAPGLGASFWFTLPGQPPG